MNEAGFEQAPIAVQNQQSFDALKQCIEHAFGASGVESFLKKVSKADLPVRRFERIVERRMLDPEKRERSAWMLYQSLPLSDQGQIREYYLTKVEEVEAGLRNKYQKIYRYW